MEVPGLQLFDAFSSSRGRSWSCTATVEAHGWFGRPWWSDGDVSDSAGVVPLEALKLWLQLPGSRHKADKPSFKEVTWNDVSMGIYFNLEGRVCGLGLLFWNLTRRVTRFDCEFPEVPFGSKDADLLNFLVGRNLELGKIELGSRPCSSIFKKKIVISQLCWMFSFQSQD